MHDNLLIPRSAIIALISEILENRERYRCLIPSELGRLVLQVDPKENFFHIEPSIVGAHLCMLYHIKDWRVRIEQEKLRKDLNEKERAVDVNISFLRAKMMERLSRHEAFRFLPPEALNIIADKMLASRSAEGIKEFTRLGIGDLLEADSNLRAFKQEKGIS